MRERGDGDPVEAHLETLATTVGRSGRASLRKEQGSHYTPPSLVAWILDRAMAACAAPRRTLDPTCGAGNFLYEVGARLVALGVSPDEVLCERLFGIDIDVRAVELCRARLLGILPRDATDAARVRAEAALCAHVVVGDALERTIAEITGVCEFDLIVGNPPFLNQLEVATAASRERAARIQERTGGVVRGYADLSAAFLLEACGHASPGGIVGFVMPQSFLSTADARAARAWLAANERIRAVWTADEHLFDDASVRVAALVIEHACGLAAGPLHGWQADCAFGPGFLAASPVKSEVLAGSESWSALFADARGVPRVDRAGCDTLASIATATADFRDQFYGLRGSIVDRRHAPEACFPRLISTRHVDLACSRWGEVPVKLLFERYACPRADRAKLEEADAMRDWVRARLVPKVLVATQTRVMEAVVDEQGEWLPVVPLLSVMPRDGARVDLWMLAAAVASPVVTAEAARVSYGAALSAGAIKLSARQLLAMPLPSNPAAWRESADHFRDASRAMSDAERWLALGRFAEASCRAHALGQDAMRAVLAFWRGRARGLAKTTAPA